MNAERLHVIAIALKTDFAEIKLQQLLDALVQSLANQVSQPNQPQHQASVSQNLTNLYDSLSESKVNSFTPAWLDIVEEIGGMEFIEKNLSAAVKAIFERNNITPSVAQQELTQISARLKPFLSSINQLCNSMTALNIGHEELEPGECEVGIVVPRAAVSNSLHDFGKELVQLNKIFSVFSEIATDSRGNFQIRNISSSELTVFLEAAPEIAACIAIAIERIVALYKSLLEIKKLKGELESQGVPKKDMSGIKDHANTLMENGIKILVDDLIDKFHKNSDKGRKNELKIEAKYALNKLAKRIDQGFGLDVRIEPTIENEESENSPSEEIVNTIIEASKNIQYIKPTGKPILTLPDSKDDET